MDPEFIKEPIVNRESEKLDEALELWREVDIEHPRLNARVWSRIANAHSNQFDKLSKDDEPESDEGDDLFGGDAK